MPRSPAAQLPAGRLCSTCVRPCSSSRRLMLARLVLVGKQVFDAREAGARRGGEAVEEADLVEEHRQVGGESRHGILGGQTTRRDCSLLYGAVSRLRENQPVTLGEHAHRLEAVGLRATASGRTAARPARADSSAPRPPRGAAPITITRPPGRSTRSSFADGGHAILGAHPVANSPPVSSMIARSNAPSSTGSRVGGAISISTSTPACVGALARARRRRVVGHDGDGAPREADLAGDGGEPAAVRAADLHERSPIFTPVMPTTSMYGSSRRHVHRRDRTSTVRRFAIRPSQLTASVHAVSDEPRTDADSEPVNCQTDIVFARAHTC